MLHCKPEPETCASAIKRDDWPAAVGLCEAEYVRSPGPEQALRFGRASINVGQGARCEQVVRPLLEGAHEADAHYLLGKAATGRGALAEAQTHFERALALHAQGGPAAALARDANELAGLRNREGKYAEALGLLARAAEAAGRAGEARLTYYAQLTRANTLRAGSDYPRAEQAIVAALAEASLPRDRAWAMLTLGLLYVDTERDALALPPLRGALALAKELELGAVARSARLNLGWLARRAGRLDEAEAAFASYDGDDDPFAVAYNLGLIAADRGDLEAAAARFAQAEQAGLKVNRFWTAPYQTGLIAERRGRLDEARAAYRRSIVALEELRDHAGPLAAHVLAAHRMPHERLIDLSAREGRWRDVLAVVLSLDLSMVLATDATPRELPSNGTPSRSAHAPVTRLQPQWLDVGLGGKGTNEPADVARTLAAWRGRRLIVLAPGSDHASAEGGRLWRLEVIDGTVRGADAGPLDRLEKLSADLEADPDNRAAARALGEAIVPVSARGQPLDVLALGSVARAPLGALRHGDALVAASTPLARVLGLRPWSKPSTVGRRAGAVVLGDPLGNLPAASQEARSIAERLGTQARLGPAADRSTLASAAGAELLHVASHAVEADEGPALRLADGELGAPALAALGPTARLVVLASCASATSRDGSGWGSLAAAFLGAGAEAVVATQWSVSDADASSVAEALYDQDVGHDIVRDPTAALADAQVRLERAVPAKAWAAFTVVRAPPFDTK
jgi:tetratricopeptide (TPR) repeat protein